MKKYLYILSIAFFTTSLVSCASMDKDQKPVSYPTLDPCTPGLLQSQKSFICLKKFKGLDFVETNIKFSADSFTLDDQAKEVLDKLYAYLKLTGNTNFVIKGYAGKIESKLIKHNDLLTKHDLRLSRDRATSVREYLINKGIKPDGMEIQALGYQDPIAPNDSNANRGINQRVEITLKSKLVDQIDNINDRVKPVKISDYTKFFANIYLLNDDQIDEMAKIYDSREKRPAFGINFKIFANKQYPAKEDNKSFSIISEPKPINTHNPDKKVYKIGSAQYNYTYKGITALTITDLKQEASVGDYVIPNDIVSSSPLPTESFRMDSKVTANVMQDVMNTGTFSFSYNSILINKGASDGLKLGAEMILYEPESRADGYPVPPKYIGHGFVYRQSDHYALILIVNSLQEITKSSMATTIL
ncbi:OmpA family protein [Allofrancisella guangzhouensis]|uniref:Membrane protein n=1 Tax=Allofrancisella guangzhouensis TaxID=594679 RepID=A0A0A8E7S6_9GAMM|nr:OmpA family protein [Allofrancisella guangzhouensis]AJC48201.1 membrane protein [Allofrancisella guangzhouensis]MBK2027068.1 OmpA family protein [Allofrancisella guangzhouensis]MBK2044558.1 OmpA family protein [Allofrancisella guangzhouensis]MBK2046110.1 OmpA family protein [Allofrancisella guangzhouensis]